MKWRKITIRTTVEAEDLVSSMLADLGVEGVQIENKVPLDEKDAKAMFIDILPELGEDDGMSEVSFYLHEESPDDSGRPAPVCIPGVDEAGTADNSYMISDRVRSTEEIEELLDRVKDGLTELSAFTDVGSGELVIGESSETDWRDSWKEFFQPIRIGSILILPSWREIPEEYRKETEAGHLKTVLIDPGVAFGTGSHETTRLCIPGLEKYVRPGSKVLDLGTGSGILGMAALKLGAAQVTAVDIDPACEEVLRKNTEMNGISEKQFRILIGNVLTDEKLAEKVREQGPYDVITANILAPVICSLAAAGAADRFAKSGGVFITSGILDTFEKDVCNAFSDNGAWQDIAVSREGEWVAVTAVRKGQV